MIVLRLDQSVLPDGRHRVAVRADDAEGVSEFAFALSDEDRRDIRWYLEEFLEYPLDPAPVLAARVERRMAEIGTELFHAVFGSENAREVWASVRGRLGEVRVEVETDVDGAAALPWELLLDPKTGRAVALQVASFVRVHRRGAVRGLRAEGADRLRVLLVICRPSGRDDVPFRSVASHLVRLGDTTADVLDLHVLRPPTFPQLTAVLEAAHAAGRPYHVVHFDGHGAYLDLRSMAQGRVERLADTRFSAPGQVEPGPHGYLLFEDPGNEHNQQLVGGSEIGALLTRAGVPVLVLNACRSAYADSGREPAEGDDPHQRVRAYGSFALEVAEQGVPGVVAMRYNVWVVTAAQFVADLYTALLAGQPLGAAVSAGRRKLAANPDRAIAFQPVPLHDWSVPIVYEAASTPILDPVRVAAPKIVVSQEARAAGPGLAADGLPHRPDAGFFGRDETLLALDRAFDKQRIALLHAYAGSGKTSTAVEFARWYHGTGGLGGGPVVFSSLEHYTPLARLLNDWAAAFASLLRANGIQWDAVNDAAARRSIALQVLAQVPALWIWDNVEPVAGFPAGSQSAWTEEEQTELADFLRDLARTKARVLLTSRRDERGWLGLLPVRVALPPMPLREMIQLTAALAERQGHRITDVADWRPLLRYTAGNPLAVTVVVGQVLREGLTSKRQIEEFVARVRAGEADLEDDEAEGRTRSLGASLGYGFAAAFSDGERAQLAVLHLFQDIVDVDALCLMGREGEHQPVPELVGLSREQGIALLDRAAELGLLTPLGHGYYMIHPALPWYFRRLFDAHHADAAVVAGAYTAAFSALAAVYCNRYYEGRTDVIATIRAEEANILHAHRLARAAGRWGEVMDCTLGLNTLYDHVGRRAEWIRLLDEMGPDLVDPDDDTQPMPGREEPWGSYARYRVMVAVGDRDWNVATRLMGPLVAWRREQAAAAVATPDDEMTDRQRAQIRDQIRSELTMGEVLREQGDPACVGYYQEAMALCQRIGDRGDEGTVAYNLAHAYLDIDELRDFDRAESLYRHALDCYPAQDGRRRAHVTAQMGKVAYIRFLESRRNKQPAETVLAHLQDAARYYLEAVERTPPDAALELATVFEALGNIYGDAMQPELALTYYQKAIRLGEYAGQRHRVGLVRYNAAVMLAEAGREADALEYARASLRDLEPYGLAASEEIGESRRLIGYLEVRRPK